MYINKILMLLRELPNEITGKLGSTGNALELYRSNLVRDNYYTSRFLTAFLSPSMQISCMTLLVAQFSYLHETNSSLIFGNNFDAENGAPSNMFRQSKILASS